MWRTLMHTNTSHTINSNETSSEHYISETYRKIDTDKESSVKSTLVSKNITIMGRRTSVRLEPEMWRSLKEISRREKCTVHDVCSMVYMCKKPLSSLTASIRVFLMLYYKAASTEDGHVKARHGNLDSMRRRVISE